MHVRSARSDDLRLLPAVEAAADTVFVPWGITDLPPPAGPDELATARKVLVAGDPPAGFLRLEEIDGRAHVEQLSVHPDHMRRGLGGALLQAALGWAADSGFAETTLVTYADIPWNAPFYRKHGFVPLPQLSTGLIALRDKEITLGLDEHGTRVVFYRTVTGRV
ncbi:GNAT family N-acetyltransferase [Allosaccharopolyspora coralli]|uniref:GNAT family N-acetyltransferase n=1 Tax=Allosaccharopolyspora coralli TaxID=2665642 RepID=A0A5Q3Q873_9PSEU|nr:GNAT family N-acetyltransferase [Allosaccharopolyspora coralli]QGK70010.1 GNAT family N-acetyltransferase [Allosaccharopolyspora coralli]